MLINNLGSSIHFTYLIIPISRNERYKLGHEVNVKINIKKRVCELGTE